LVTRAWGRSSEYDLGTRAYELAARIFTAAITHVGLLNVVDLKTGLRQRDVGSDAYKRFTHILRIDRTEFNPTRARSVAAPGASVF
jgi:hypothetical protein